jgi:hypothetical protein
MVYKELFLSKPATITFYVFTLFLMIAFTVMVVMLIPVCIFSFSVGRDAVKIFLQLVKIFVILLNIVSTYWIY